MVRDGVGPLVRIGSTATTTIVLFHILYYTAT